MRLLRLECLHGVDGNGTRAGNRAASTAISASSIAEDMKIAGLLGWISNRKL
jgi:hypothetical protein